MLLAICVFVWLIAPPVMEKLKVYVGLFRRTPTQFGSAASRN